MSYENLKSTKMLASHCAVCARPLRDAKSVELGIGPDCAEKYGYDIEVDPAKRKRANQLVFLIADKQNGLDAVEACRELIHLGFVKLASRIATRILSVRVLLDTQNPSRYLVSTPYTPLAVREISQVPGRMWDATNYVNVVPVTSKNKLWSALVRAFPGVEMLGPDGNFYLLASKAERNAPKVAPTVAPLRVA